MPFHAPFECEYGKYYKPRLLFSYKNIYFKMLCHVYGNWDFSTSHKTVQLNAAGVIYLCMWTEKMKFNQILLTRKVDF